MSVLDAFALTDRVALVTGATRGLGRAFAVALAEAGADVVIHGRDADAASAVKTEIESLGRRAWVVLGDLTEPGAADRVAADAVGRAGRIDVLINNAGACIHRPALEVTDDEWSHVFETNVTALWRMSRAVGRTWSNAETAASSTSAPSRA
ncbi:SDR family NAD(P)-dependent oxidoreductase [Microbacterium sp. NIBRBAC000506063]|uniref:SDR family NAD(P)-dependent oxidoreductase n=1 Tax=Microbacterium sp. NIBRBAC000506063 TaxID=2734618 RepID=UPI00398135EE